MVNIGAMVKIESSCSIQMLDKSISDNRRQIAILHSYLKILVLTSYLMFNEFQLSRINQLLHFNKYFIICTSLKFMINVSLKFDKFTMLSAVTEYDPKVFKLVLHGIGLFFNQTMIY